VVTAGNGAAIRVVPDGTTAISIQLQNGEPSGWVLRGPLVRPDERQFASPATVVGVRLRPGVAFLLSRVAAHTMVGRRVSLGSVPAFEELADDEATPREPLRCIDVLQRFLVRRLQGAAVHEVVAAAMEEIGRAHGCVHVEDVASRCGVSPRHLNRLMRLWVGYGAKRFATISRFQESLGRIDVSPALSAAALASETVISINLT
jgi:hypothetical protein